MRFFSSSMGPKNYSFGWGLHRNQCRLACRYRISASCKLCLRTHTEFARVPNAENKVRAWQPPHSVPVCLPISGQWT